MNQDTMEDVINARTLLDSIQGKHVVNTLESKVSHKSTKVASAMTVKLIEDVKEWRKKLTRTGMQSLIRFRGTMFEIASTALSNARLSTPWVIPPNSIDQVSYSPLSMIAITLSTSLV